MTAETSRRIKLLLLGVAIGFACTWTAALSLWLTPAPSDIRLSFAQTSPSENSKLPQNALDNDMPQLGMGTFWLDGKLMESFGPYSPYVVRYSLFTVSLILMLLLFLRIHKPAEEDHIEWLLLFLLTVSGTFFFSIKFFFWLDYLVVIPLSLVSVIMIRRNAPAWQLFLLTLLVMYVKMSGFYILIVFFGIYLRPVEFRRYWKLIVIAVLISVVHFFAKWGFDSVADRGRSGIVNFPAYSLMGLNLLTKPWLFFTFFDKAQQKIINDVDLLLVFKALIFLSTTAWLIVKKFPGIVFRILCVVTAFICSLVIIRDHPTLHDFAAYNGIIELGLISLLWTVYRISGDKLRKIMFVIIGVLFLSQMLLWSRSFRALEPSTSKASLVSKLQEETRQRRHLFLFCSWNVGEFEYFLKNVTVHYSLWAEPFDSIGFRSGGPSLFLIPRGCLHESVTPQMRDKYQRIIDGNHLKLIETVRIDRNQIYDLYEAP